jgi:hypothetical protein
VSLGGGCPSAVIIAGGGTVGAGAGNELVLPIC